jgi:hydroxymethylglutaryl-CoA reductase
MTNSRIAGFYNQTLDQRRANLLDASGLTAPELAAWTTGGLSPESADPMIENVVGMHALPLGIGLNFQVNGRDVLVPMAIEEPSVVAGASFMAKLARAGGGFYATVSAPHMIGQMQVINLPNVEEARLKIYEHKAELLAEANTIDPVLKKFGGGARDLEVRVIKESAIGAFIVVHLIYDVRDAMGANQPGRQTSRPRPLHHPRQPVDRGIRILQRRDRPRRHHRRLGIRGL